MLMSTTSREQQRLIRSERLRKLRVGQGLITAEQIMKIKECLQFKPKMTRKEIIKKTGMSNYHIRNTKKGMFDYLLEQH